MLYVDVEIWIEISNGDFSWFQWRHRNLIVEIFHRDMFEDMKNSMEIWRSCHEDFYYELNGDMDISPWKFFIESLKTSKKLLLLFKKFKRLRYNFENYLILASASRGFFLVCSSCIFFFTNYWRYSLEINLLISFFKTLYFLVS